MKKLMMLVMAVTAMMLVGCSDNVSKYEKLTRESLAIAEKAGGPKVSEEMVKKDIEEFKNLSSDEQKKRLKALEAIIDLAKTQMKK